MRGLSSIVLVPALTLSVLTWLPSALAEDAPEALANQAAPAPTADQAAPSPRPHTRLKWQERFVQA
ncbi:MAG: hypothetical protein ACJ8AI_15875, partial [Rhodopila sp.]